MEVSGSLAPAALDAHFDRLRANLIRCEECNENFFFDFLRHPRYFVTHFKACHLKNVLYRFNGCSEEENQRVRFGPRRKKDAHAWFAQLKSTEKRMISMQDNKWSEIAEKEVWACRLCQQTRRSGDLPQHAFEPSELGRRQALQHLQKLHEPVYAAFLRCTPTVEASGGGPRSTETHLGLTEQWAASTAASTATSSAPSASPSVTDATLPSSEPTEPRRTTEAQRSRLRRLRATPEARQAEAERSKRRREQLTPAQRQADAERRARKRQRDEERVRSRTRREDSSPQAREREMQRSRERRRNATEQQRRREAQRSRQRRENATDEQRLRERERCRRRYEAKKRMQEGTGLAPGSGCGSTSGASTPPASAPTRFEDVQRRSQQLEQQRAGLGLQLQSLYASLAAPAEAEARAAEAREAEASQQSRK